MSHVRPGSSSKSSRRRSAIERLEKHLGDHKKNHSVAGFYDVKNNKEYYSDAIENVVNNLNDEIKNNFESHDKIQKKELEHLKEISS